MQIHRHRPTAVDAFKLLLSEIFGAVPDFDNELSSSPGSSQQNQCQATSYSCTPLNLINDFVATIILVIVNQVNLHTKSDMEFYGKSLYVDVVA